VKNLITILKQEHTVIYEKFKVFFISNPCLNTEEKQVLMFLDILNILSEIINENFNINSDKETNHLKILNCLYQDFCDHFNVSSNIVSNQY